jgi:outer membrane protein assembly factor BamB
MFCIAAGEMRPRFFSMARSLLFCLLLLVALSVPTASRAADWPHWRGPNFDGKTVETLGPVTTLSERWTAEVGIGFSSFAVVDERVYTMGFQQEKECVWCLHARTGATLWRHDYPAALHAKYYEGGPGVTPTVTAEAVYVLGKQGQAFALHPATGAVIWQRDLKADHALELPEWHFAGSPFCWGDLVVFNVGSRGLALDRRDGRTVWQHGGAATGYSTPVPLPAALGGKDVLALFLGRSLSGIAAADGREVWTLPWKRLNATDPISDGADILVSSIGGSALKRRRADGDWDTVWERKDFQNYFNPSVKIGDHLYGLNGTTHKPTTLVCIEWASGKECWQEPGHTTGGLVATADYLVLCDQGEIMIFRPDPTQLDVVHRQTVLPGKCWTAPVVAGGLIYARNAAGRVVCLQPQGGE